MDLRLSPAELCSDNPHLQHCCGCKKLLREFSTLHESIQEYANLLTERAAESIAVGESAVRFEVGRVDLPPADVETSRDSIRWFAPALAMSLALLAMMILPSLSDQTGAGFGPMTEHSGGLEFHVADVSQIPVPGELLKNRIAAENASDSGLVSTLYAAGSGNWPGWQRQPFVPEIRPAVATGSELPRQTIVSCLQIADQMPGVRPVRRSFVNTVDWFWKSVPQPKIPSLPDLLPEFGHVEGLAGWYRV